jgi:hypothetical protein
MSDDGSNRSAGLPKARPIGFQPGNTLRPAQTLFRHGFYASRDKMTAEQYQTVEAILPLPHCGEADRLAAEEVARLLTIIAAVDRQLSSAA